MSCLPGYRLRTDEIGLVCPVAGYALIIFIPVLPAIAGLKQGTKFSIHNRLRVIGNYICSALGLAA
jgi:hypothetical protein